jgi:hypothetical protein
MLHCNVVIQQMYEKGFAVNINPYPANVEKMVNY